MKNIHPFKAFVFVGSLCVMAFILNSRSFFRHEVFVAPTRENPSPSTTLSASETHIILVTADKPTESVSLTGPHGESRGVNFRIMSDDTGYFVIYNGGPTVIGGFEQFFPARNKKPPGWTGGDVGKNKTLFVQFRLEAGSQPTQIALTFFPLDDRTR